MSTPGRALRAVLYIGAATKFREQSMKAILVCAVATLAISAAAAQAQTSVTAEDKTQIQELVSRYAVALAGCDAAGFAHLFDPASGYFASGFRGVVAGEDRLVALVDSERHCIAPNPNGAQRPGGNAPTVIVESDANGVFGTVKLGDIAQYQDRYVRTAGGWKFASRSVLTSAELAAGLGAKEMLAIQALSRDLKVADHYDTDKDTGVKRFLSSGVVILVKDGVVGGRVYLDDGSHYADTYEQTAAGQWRIKSRELMPAEGKQ